MPAVLRPLCRSNFAPMRRVPRPSLPLASPPLITIISISLVVFLSSNGLLGHSFCTECILRAFDSNTAWCVCFLFFYPFSHPAHFSIKLILFSPMCREVAHLPPQPAINHTLAALVDKFFHAQLTKRKSESVHLSDSQNFIPLFLLTTCLFPCESMQLHVFEPR